MLSRPSNTRPPREFVEKLHKYGIMDTPWLIHVDPVTQLLHLFENRQLQFSVPISTAALGLGNLKDSNQTPMGLLRVSARIGENIPIRGIFRERTFTGQVWTPGTAASGVNSDLILSRILWLEGMEPGVNKGGNVDTYSRYIYIHGTNHEDKIGTPASHGCIRMRNADVIRLFSKAWMGTLVFVGINTD